jgi:hypothetical protein
LLLHLSRAMYSCLFGSNDFVLDVLVVVGSPTCRTQAVHVVLDIVVAELTYLQHFVSLVAQSRGAWQGSKPGIRKDKA